jgi:transposase
MPLDSSGHFCKRLQEPKNGDLVRLSPCEMMHEPRFIGLLTGVSGSLALFGCSFPCSALLKSPSAIRHYWATKRAQFRAASTSDVSDAEWDFCRPYLVLMKEDAPQRDYPMRELFNALRHIVRCGCQWRMMLHDLPPWQNAYQQAQRWMKACCFAALAHDLSELSHLVKSRKAWPTVVIMDGRTLQSSPESGARVGYDGYKRRKGSKVHIAADTLGHLLALKVTAAN